MKTYRTVQGDTWDVIAYRELGSCRYTALLMRENQKHIHTLIFPPGVVLRLPEVLPETVPVKLPPWKRGAKDG